MPMDRKLNPTQLKFEHKHEKFNSNSPYLSSHSIVHGRFFDLSGVRGVEVATGADESRGIATPRGTNTTTACRLRLCRSDVFRPVNLSSTPATQIQGAPIKVGDIVVLN